MARAAAVVEDDVFLGNPLRDEASQVAVRDEQDVPLRQLAHDLDRVGRGHAHVAPALHLNRGIHVAGDRQVVAVFGAGRVDRGPLDHVRHRAVRRRLGQEDRLVAIEQLRALPHELDTAQDDGPLGQGFREFCQVKRVAHVICDRLDLGLHIIVREDHRIALGLELLDALAHGRIDRRRLGHGFLQPCRIELEEVWHCRAPLTRQLTRQCARGTEPPNTGRRAGGAA